MSQMSRAPRPSISKVGIHIQLIAPIAPFPIIPPLRVAPVIVPPPNSGMMTGATLSGGMMGNGAMGGLGWMWIPTLLMLGLCVLLAWVIFGQKK